MKSSGRPGQKNERLKKMIKIEFDNRTDQGVNDALKAQILDFIERTVESEGIEPDVEVEISYSMVTPDEIQAINAEYRHQDKATDVLSFPMNDFTPEDAIIELEEGMPLVLGDIIVNLEQAEKQAKEYGNTFEAEVCYLSVHSTLHLLGYDHMVPGDKQVMRTREKAIMGQED